MRHRMFRTIVLMALVLAPLSACGKKAPPDPPDKNQNAYPATYPSNNDDPRDVRH